MSRKNSILGLSDPKKAFFFIYIYFYTHENLKFYAQLSLKFFLSPRGLGGVPTHLNLLRLNNLGDTICKKSILPLGYSCLTNKIFWGFFFSIPSFESSVKSGQ